MALTGFQTGFTYKMLSLDPEVGSCTMTGAARWRLQAAARFQLSPSSSSSSSKARSKVGDADCVRGHYFYRTGGLCMPEISTEQGALLLMMYNTGEPSHEESDEHHPLVAHRAVPRRRHVFRHRLGAGQCRQPIGCLGLHDQAAEFQSLKRSRMTFLYCMTPALPRRTTFPITIAPKRVITCGARRG